MPLLAALLLPALVHIQAEPKWTTMFNGKDLSGWTPKIKGYKLGDNFGKTFRVVNGVIQVNYDGYGGEFKERFGHLFYKSKFSSYIMRLEYRFTGEQCPGGPGWAWRNSGVMIHGQDPKTMRLDQDFPVSAEVQLLGGQASGERTTGNLCTPGTNVVREGKLWTPHCLNSKSETFAGDIWVKAEIEVHGTGEVIHRINGKEVMRYEQVQYDPNDADGKTLIKDGKLLIKEGTISLQSESHACEFRNIQIRKI